MTGIPVISELKNEASKTDFNMNPKEKLNEWQPFLIWSMSLGYLKKL